MFAFPILIHLCFLLKTAQRASDAWTATTVRIGEMYPDISVQCERDLQEVCKSPSVPAQPVKKDSSTLLVSDPISVDSPLTEIPVEHAEEIQQQESEAVFNVPQTRQLRTASLGSRRLSEESPSSDSPVFPFECLERAWTEQRVSLGCSASLQQLRSVQELKRQQEWNVKTSLWVFWVTWLVFVLCSGIGQWMLGGMLGWIINNRLAVWGLLVKCYWAINAVLWIVTMSTGNSTIYFVWWAWMMVWIFGLVDESKENGAQACSSSTQQTDACCKVDSDDPSTIAESCCKNCNGTGSTDCASCCSDECCDETCALSDATTEEELLIPAPAAGEKAL